MARFLPDTSCMVAALCSWHERHDAASREIERRLDAGETLVVAAPALVETYAVLTRLPPPHRLSPSISGEMLATSFLRDEVTIVALDVTAYRRLLIDAPDLRIAGGSVYDAVIVSCARLAAVDTILTFNERHFRSLGVEEVETMAPS